jgi:tetratricopeptide (TPR) repeat protein
MLRLAGLAALTFTLTTSLAAQQPSAEEPCPEREALFEVPIDVHLAQMEKERRQRDKNPLPERVCVWGWCREAGPKFPGPKPKKDPEAEVRHETRSAPSGQSSSREGRPRDPAPPPGESPPPSCDIESARRDLAQTIKHVEVGDYYFKEKNYRAALSRFEDASVIKPNDPAIQLRLARTLEKLDRRDDALAHYRAVAGSGWQGPGVDEAKAAVARLTPAPANTP